MRALVVDAEGRVFLVKHSYVSGWHLPGGGVETGETLMMALARELREEGNIELIGAPTLFAIYFNRRVSRRDHVALYVVRSFRQTRPAASESVKSWRTAFSHPIRCRRKRQRRPASASPKCSPDAPSPSCGDCSGDITAV